MALAYRASAQVFGTTTSTNITIPATVQVGDLLIMQAVGGWAPNLPVGWTQDYYNNGSVNIRAFLVHRIAQAGDAGSTLTITWQNSFDHVINLLAVSGGTTIRSANNNHSTTGGTGSLGPFAAATGDLVISMGGDRSSGGPATLANGTTTDSGGTTMGGVIGYELLATNKPGAQKFTTSIEGSGYLYSLVIVDGGNTPPNYAVAESSYIDVLATSTTNAQVEASYVDTLIVGQASAQIESSYIDVLGSNAQASAQVEASYVDVIGSSVVAQVESVYQEILAIPPTPVQVESVYQESLGIPANTPLQVEAVYQEILISGPRVQAEAVYAEVVAAGAPLLQVESVYAEAVAGGAPRIQAESIYLEVVVMSYPPHRGWGLGL